MAFKEFTGKLDAAPAPPPARFAEFTGKLDEAPAAAAPEPQAPLGNPMGDDVSAIAAAGQDQPTVLDRPAVAPAPFDMRAEIARQRQQDQTVAQIQSERLARQGAQEATATTADNFTPMSTDTTMGGRIISGAKAAGYGGLKTGANMLSTGADLIGADNFADRAADYAGHLGGEQQAAMGLNADSTVSKAVAGAGTLAQLAFGAPGVASMTAGAFADSMAESREAGQTVDEALPRAAAMATVSALSLKFQAPAIEKSLGALLGNVAPSQFGKVMAEGLVRNVGGMEAQTVVTDLYDKLVPGGLKPNLTMSDMLDHIVDTFKTAALTSAALPGAPMAIRHADSAIGHAMDVGRYGANEANLARAINTDVANGEFQRSGPGGIEEFASRSLTPSFADPRFVIPGTERRAEAPAVAPEPATPAASIKPVDPAAILSAPDPVAAAMASLPDVTVEPTRAPPAPVLPDALTRNLDTTVKLGGRDISSYGTDELQGLLSRVEPEDSTHGKIAAELERRAPAETAQPGSDLVAENAARIADTNTAFAEHGRDLSPEARADFPKPDLTPAAPEVVAHLDPVIRAISDVLGTEPVAVAHSPTLPDGVNAIGHSVVNVEGLAKPAAFVVAHESLHSLQTLARLGERMGADATPEQRDALRIWAPMEKALWDMVPQKARDAYASKVLGFKPEDMLDPSKQRTLRDEMLADFGAKRLTNRADLEELAKHEPKLFGEFAGRMIDWIGKVIDALKGKRSLGAHDIDKHIADLNSAKMMWRDALVSWKKRGGAEAAPEVREPEFRSYADMSPKEQAAWDKKHGIPPGRRQEVEAKLAKMQADTRAFQDGQARAYGRKAAESTGMDYDAWLKANPGEREAAYSRRTPEEQERSEAALKKIGAIKDLFQYPKGQGKKLEQVAKSIDPRAQVRVLSQDGRFERYRLTLPPHVEIDEATGQKIMVPGGDVGIRVRKSFKGELHPDGYYGYSSYDADPATAFAERPGANADALGHKADVILDASLLNKGDGGRLAYAIASDFAKNNGHVFIGDPSGLSDQALVRRTEQMLSSALKHGTTDHIAPHPRQLVGDEKLGVPPLHWDYADPVGNIERMIEVSRQNADNQHPVKFDFDPATGEFHEGGFSFDREGLGAVSNRFEGRGGAGSATLARAALLRAVLRGSGEEGAGQRGRDVLLEKLLQGASEHAADRQALNKAFYSRRTEEDGNEVNISQDARGGGHPEPGEPELHGDVRSSGALLDTEAPAGRYIAKTILGEAATRKIGASRVSTAEQAARATAYLYKSAVERFDGIVTDEAGKVLGIVGGFKGELSAASIYPSTLIAEAVRIPGAAHIWFSHNHQSGEHSLSAADIRLNGALSDAFRGSGIEPMGLLAVTGKRYSHVDADGDISSGGIAPPSASHEVPAIERELVPPGEDVGRPQVDSPSAAKAIAKRLYDETGAPGLMLMDAQLKLSAWVPLHESMRGELRNTGALNAIYRAVSHSSAGSAIIVHDGSLDGSLPGRGVTLSQNIGAALEKAGVRVVDSIDVASMRSAAERGDDISAGPLYSARDATDESRDDGSFNLGPKALLGKARQAPDVLSRMVDATLDKSGVYNAVAPMSSGTKEARAVAQRFVNEERAATYQWTRMQTDIMKRFTPEQREAMFNAADEQNTLMTRGEDTQGRGIDTLPPDQRAVMDQMHDYGQKLWEMAKDAGLVKADNDGVAYWTPRMMAMVDEAGNTTEAKSTGKKGTSSGEGRNITTTASSLKARKYETAAETEAAMAAKGGKLVRDIATMPLALMRLEKAIAGRQLINTIKEIGLIGGKDLVSGAAKEGFFTLDHPAFKTFRPELKNEDGKWSVVTKEDGSPVMESVPLFISKDFEGPLKAIMSGQDGPMYRAYMLLKSKAMSAIMFSPLIHNMVIAGRAFAYAGLKLPAVYVHGYFARKDGQMMDLAIRHGLVPISGANHTMLDVGDVARGIGKEGGWGDPNESWAALGAKAIGNKVHDGWGDAAKSGLDRFGNFWHGTLLWDRVGDLQAGIFQDAFKKLQSKGLSEGVAATLAAHYANRYAGAVGRENMSNAARKWLNVLLFSRSFNVGNVGAVKDVLFGLPAGLRAQVESLAASEKEASDALGMAKRKAFSGLVLDLAAAIIATSVYQDWKKRDKDKALIDQLAEAGAGYKQRAAEMVEGIKAHPLNPKSYSPYELSSTRNNEPGKEDRIDLGAQENSARHEYQRLPTGKVVEDTIGWTTHPTDTAMKKLSPMVKSLLGVALNNSAVGSGFEKPVWDPSGTLTQKAMDIAKHLVGAELPIDQLKTGQKIVNGTATQLDKDKFAGNFTGLSVSQGHPMGPEGKVAQMVEDRLKASKAYVLESVKFDVDAGKIDEAIQRLVDVGFTQREALKAVGRIQNPATGVSKAVMKRFFQHASEDEQAAMERVGK